MSDAGVALHDEYRDLIREVYIDPIRSVLIVDDEYPTLDGLVKDCLGVDGAWESKAPRAKYNAEKVLDFLRYCRGDGRKWLVDVHDGRNVDDEGNPWTTSHLHQSDLLILDYQLHGDHADEENAISVLGSLAETDHFNLVVVYTQHDIDDAFKRIVLGFLTKWDEIASDSLSHIEEQVDRWEDEEEGVSERLLECVNEDTYLRFRRSGSDDLSLFRDDPDVRRYLGLFSEKPGSIKLGKENLFKWLLLKREQALGDQLSTKNRGQVRWEKRNGKANWIRTNLLFVTVVSKKKDVEELPVKILDALTTWAPSPHRLIMSKMRAELEARGVNAEDAALSDRLMQSGWFLELIRANDDERSAGITASVARHWEGLLDAVEADVINFSKKVLSYASNNPPDHFEAVLRYFHVDLDEEKTHIDALMRLNAYNCGKPPEGWHLTTGHVLEIDGDYWVCLSPACDLAPQQKTTEKFEALSPAMPFKAVKLNPFGKNEKKALKKANSNQCLFLKIDEKIQAFNFTVINAPLANPTWEEMFADNHGKFDPVSKTLKVARLKWNRQQTEAPSSEWSDAIIVAQLRYEYALNLLQRLGGALSRIGLDFCSLKQLKRST